MNPLNLANKIGEYDVAFVVLDALRFDVAAAAFARGATPNFARLFPGAWEERHSPASFTYPAHQAFFAGFLPTPVRPPWPQRLFAARFAGSETCGPDTWVFDEADVVAAFRARHYRTICIGGVGFFNKQSALSRVLPELFEESHWSPEMGVTSPHSTEKQFELAAARLASVPSAERVFLFMNVSAIHQPNYFYVPNATCDDLRTHLAALQYVDGKLEILIDALRRRGPCFLIVCSDHGTLYGEDGFIGHRVGHPAVWTVPYAECLL